MKGSLHLRIPGTILGGYPEHLDPLKRRLFLTVVMKSRQAPASISCAREGKKPRDVTEKPKLLVSSRDMAERRLACPFTRPFANRPPHHAHACHSSPRLSPHARSCTHPVCAPCARVWPQHQIQSAVSRKMQEIAKLRDTQRSRMRSTGVP